MKNLLYILLFFPLMVLSQTPHQNYIKTTTYKDSTLALQTSVPRQNVQITYFDGLGRPLQTVNSKAGGQGQDIITPMEYDLFGRQTKEYLPFPVTANNLITSAYQPNALVATNTNGVYSFYNTAKYESTKNPYSEKRYENSPLNRVKEQGAPGESWKLYDYALSGTNAIFTAFHQSFDSNVCDAGYPGLSLPGTDVKLETKGNTLVFTFKTSLNYNQDIYKNTVGCSFSMRSIDIDLLNQATGNPVPVPDVELGELIDDLGNPTGYIAYIQNNKILFRLKVPGVYQLVKKFDTKYSVDLTPYLTTPDMHTVKYEYMTNITNEVHYFGVDFVNGNTEETSLTYKGYYAPNQLYKTVTKDENWTKGDGNNKTAEEFTDKQGRIVLKRTYNANARHDTYYVYDKFSNLTYVIPPLASDAVVSENFNVFTPQLINFPVTRLLNVDEDKEKGYNDEISKYNNLDILNVDMMGKYGIQGGYSVRIDENANVILNLNFQTEKPIEIKTGVIAELWNYGKFTNKELGRIYSAANKCEYIFSLKDDMIQVTGSGNVPSVATTLNGYQKLGYSKNYPWTKVCNVDGTEADAYEKELRDIDNSDILTVDIPNKKNTHGGLNITLDEADVISLSLNITSDEEFELLNGAIFALDVDRSVPDMYIGQLKANKYKYDFEIKNNTLYISGYGAVPVLSGAFTHSIVRSGVVNNDAVNGLCYIYNYDKRNRNIKKHIPDNGWTYTVYDVLDRPVLTQDENLRTKKVDDADNYNWEFIKYDVQGRVIITGLVRNEYSRVDLQEWFNIASNEPLYEEKSADAVLNNWISIYYTNVSGYNSGLVLTANYYDDYIFDSRADITGYPSAGPGFIPTDNVKGLATGSIARVGFTTDYDVKKVVYDEKARPIWSSDFNRLLNSWQIVKTYLDFTGKTIKTTTSHQQYGNDPITYHDYFRYDDANRLTRQFRKVVSPYNQYMRPIAWNHYDELGQLDQKKVGGLSVSEQTDNYTSFPGYQHVDYTYNIRGWLKGINDPDVVSNDGLGDLFKFAIKYDNLYNGNISATKWQSSIDGVNRSYNYSYDALNRLNAANFTGGGQNFNENGISYDKNGNIMALTRYGQKQDNTNGLIDKLSYIYKPMSNQLLKVTDYSYEPNGFIDGNGGADNDYDYDAAGNLKKDLNKGIGKYTEYEIQYNHMNLPVKVSWKDDLYIEYTYNADGTKIRKRVNNYGAVTTTDYFGGFVYKNNALEYFSHPEGYVSGENGGFSRYVFQYKDHLGNIRMSYRDANGNGTIEGSEITEETNYYPFGMQHKGYNEVAFSSNLGQKIKYNGKELQDELGLGWYDYQARNYDPAIGRWFNVDPLAEQSRRWSPYTYCFDNPMRFVDPDGMMPDDWIKWRSSSGNVHVTYDSSITSVQGAIDKGYTNVEQVFSAAPGSTSDGENFNFYSDGAYSVNGTMYDVDNTSYSTIGGATISENKSIGDALGDFGPGALDKGGNALSTVAVLSAESGVGAPLAPALGTLAGAFKTAAVGAEMLNEAIERPGKGKGSVPKAERDPKRGYSKKATGKMLEKQNGKCAECGEDKDLDQVQGHHIQRHADGGKTNEDNGAALCIPCHTQIHK